MKHFFYLYAHIWIYTKAYAWLYIQNPLKTRDARGYIQNPLKTRDEIRILLEIKWKTYYFKIIYLKDQVFLNPRFLDEILGVCKCGNCVPYIPVQFLPNKINVLQIFLYSVKLDIYIVENTILAKNIIHRYSKTLR